MIMTLSCGAGIMDNGENPLLSEWNTEFGIPPFDQIRTEHYKPAFESAMQMHNQEIDAIVNSEEEPTFENVIVALDNSGIKLAEINLIFGMLSSSDLDAEMQEVQNTIIPRVEEHFNAIMLNDSLFARVKAVYDKRMTLGLDAVQMRLVEKTYNDFVRSGALLSEENKARLMQINAQLSELSIRFGNNLLTENGSFFLELNAQQVEDLPEGVRNQAAEAATAMGKQGSYVFTLDKPSMLPFLTYSKNRDLRRELYNGYIMRCNNDNEYDNKQIAEEMARLRVEKAQLLGYDSYSHYVTSDQMSGSPEAVYRLLDEIWEPALESAKRELEVMQELFARDFPGETFEKSDWWYYAEQVRKQRYQLDEEVVRQYLSLDNVCRGMFDLANRLYGVSFRPLSSAPRYHKECTAYQVLDLDGSHVGVLYIDPYPRKSKSGGAWCGNFTEQRYVDGERKAPVLGIVCNFTPPVGDTPALLTFDEAETMFHEFGHALHFLFADVRYRGLTDVEGDFVELPSQIMENWAFEPEIMKMYATHYRTGEVIPDNLIAKIQNASLFNQGFTTTELAAAALIDMDIHSLTSYTDMDIMDFEKYNLATRRGLIPEIEPRYRYTYFAHIFNGGYSSGYYFYLWAEVLDKDAFAAFKQSSDICDKELAHSFRYDLLAQGGQLPGMEMYRKFRGADPDKTAMLKARGLWSEPEVVDSLGDESMEPAEPIVNQPRGQRPPVVMPGKPALVPKHERK